MDLDADPSGIARSFQRYTSRVTGGKCAHVSSHSIHKFFHIWRVNLMRLSSAARGCCIIVFDGENRCASDLASASAADFPPGPAR